MIPKIKYKVQFNDLIYEDYIKIANKYFYGNYYYFLI